MSKYMIALAATVGILVYSPNALADQNADGGAGYRLMYEIIFLIGAVAGTVLSFKISKAFKAGKLALPWMLITGACIIFGVSAILSMMVHIDLIHGNESLGALVCAIGMIALLSAGYLYMRAILR